MNEEMLKRAVAEAASKIGEVPGKSALAEIIVKTLNPNYLTLDVFSGFMPTQRYNPGDNILVKVRKGKYAVKSFVPKVLGL